MASPSPVAFIDGEFVPLADAKISILDTGFFRSDVVYDVVSTWKGLFFRLDDHVERFLASAAGVRMECPESADRIRRILAGCVQRGGLQDAYVYMALTRGPYLGHDLREFRPNFLAFAIPYVWLIPLEQQEVGSSVVVARTPRIDRASVEPRFKNHHWGDLTRGQFEAIDAGAETAILCDAAGILAEGPGFNFFFARDGRLFTPRTNVLEGITRKTVFDLARELGIPAEAGDYPADALRGADEAFLCTTAGGIMPVTRVDGKPLADDKPGLLSTRLRSLYWAKREAGWLGTPVADLVEAGEA
jgi:branched-chain amino acid aminotransferase